MSDILNAYSFFFIYAFIGWCIEVIYHGVIVNKFVNRGFLNGPICPVYGVGFYGIVLLLTPVIDNFALLFFGSMLITSLIELVAGFVLFKIFNLRWWDYSGNKLNLGGFICLRFSIYWGLAGTFAMLVIHPFVSSLVYLIPDIIKIIVLSGFSIVFITDLIATVLAVLKIKDKITVINEASAEIKAVSNRIGIRIYDHVEPVVKRTVPVIEGYSEIRELYNKNKAEEKKLYLEHRAQERDLYEKLRSKERKEIEEDLKFFTNRINDAINSINEHEHYVLRRINNTGKHKVAITRLISKELYDADSEEEEKVDL